LAEQNALKANPQTPAPSRKLGPLTSLGRQKARALRITTATIATKIMRGAPKTAAVPRIAPTMDGMRILGQDHVSER
jgi:hypothetical protein